jgi:type IV pilus secretin PilQ/predicted competence protein
MKRHKQPLIFFMGGILFFFLGLGGHPTALWAKGGKTVPNAQLIQIEDQGMPDRFRVILKLTGPVKAQDFPMTQPLPRLVIDLTPCVLSAKGAYAFKESPFAGIRVAQFSSKTVRVVFDFSKLVPHKISHQKGKPYQIIVDFPKMQPQETQPVSKKGGKLEENYLPQTPLETFKKEKASQDLRQKIEKAHAHKPPFSMDFYMANLHNVLRLIGSYGEKNIIVGEEVKDKKVTLSLKDIYWEDAFNSLLEGNNLEKVSQGENTFLVTTKENYKKIRDENTKRRMEEAKTRQEELKTSELERKSPDLWETREIQINNVDAKSVEEMIQASIEKEKKITSERGPGNTVTETLKTPGANVHIMSVPQSNIIIARGPQKELDYIEGLIKTIDQPVPQVMIEARIVEADANFTRDMGIRWGGGAAFGDTHTPFAGTVRGGSAGGSGATENNYAVNLPLQATSRAFGGLGFSFATTNFNLDVRIQAMEQQGRGKTISSPKVLTLDNKKATIKQGKSIPVTTRTENNTFSTTYKDAALVLTVTPHISSNKKIRIELSISKDEPDFVHLDSLGNPAISTKKADTEMIINDGDTVVIGGIIFKKETYLDNKVPGLGDIPILGWLFKTKYRTTEDTELLIFLTPRIYRSSLSERFGSES